MTDRNSVQSLAAVVGLAFLVVGVLGFVPGVTTHYGDMSFAGHGSHAKLLGVFQTSVLQNLIHLAFGIAGLALSRVVESADAFLRGGGVVYLALWVIGVVGAGRWIPTNTADNWLRLMLGVAMIGLAHLADRGAASAVAASP